MRFLACPSGGPVRRSRLLKNRPKLPHSRAHGSARVQEWQDDRGFVRVQVADPDGYRVELFVITHTPATSRPPRSRWASFVADADEDRPRILHEQGTPDHRLRVEHNRDTVLVHLSDEDGRG